MIKRFLFLAVTIAALSTLSYSQWTKVPFGNPALDTLKANSGGHGAAIDPDGKIWVAAYRPFAADSVLIPSTGKYSVTRPVYVFNADGSPAPFSPIKAHVENGVTTALYSGSNTGIIADKDGNIILSNGYELFRFNYKTGAGKGLYLCPMSLTKAAVDDNNYIYVSGTLGGYPIIVLNPDMTFNSNAVDTLKDIGRTFDVSKDGNTLYAHRFTAFCTYVYHRNSEFDPYVLVDTAFRGFKIEGSGFNPGNGLLYVSCGSFADKPQTDPTIPGLFYTKATIGTYYGVDVRTIGSFKILDSLKWTFSIPGNTDERNRGIVFSKDGKTAILSTFGASTYPIEQKLTTTKLVQTGVIKDNNTFVTDYTLSQNYPNPFNPTTEIKFSVAKEGFVSLKVYDMLGKEVATLVSENMKSGSYTASFNAQNLTSGMYIYQLTVNGVALSHKMTLLK